MYRSYTKCKKNKSPEHDGLPSEFYKTFWESLKENYYCTIKKHYEPETMAYSQRLSLITLLFKKGDPQTLNNYRPISLINNDYKIIAFIFANRLQNILDKTIHINQLAYIKGLINVKRKINCQHLFDFYDENDLKSILLFLNFQKAFHSLEWDFMLRVLKKFDFGESFFLKWINILYNKPIFRIKNNGWISKTWNM